MKPENSQGTNSSKICHHANLTLGRKNHGNHRYTLKKKKNDILKIYFWENNCDVNKVTHKSLIQKYTQGSFCYIKSGEPQQTFFFFFFFLQLPIDIIYQRFNLSSNALTYHRLRPLQIKIKRNHTQCYSHVKMLTDTNQSSHQHWISNICT